jgi:cobalt/nickel transport protein
MRPENVITLVMAVLLPVVVSVGAAQESGKWAGADDLAQKEVGKITNGTYEPWFKPLWKPPSGEIETFLFSLQAAIGALIIGYFVGYYKGKSRR